MITRRLFLSLFATLGWAVSAHAADPAATKPADQVIKAAVTDFQNLIRENHVKYAADLQGFYTVVDKEVVPFFDTKGIAQLVLGKNWKTATPEQRTRFEAAFKDSLIRTYARAMLDYYDSIDTEWAPLRAEAGATDVTVNVKLVRQNAPPIPLAFSVRQVSGDWKIYDISVENISLVTNFRSQINAEIKTSGLDTVIKKFEDNTYFSKKPPVTGAASGGG